MSEVQNFDVVQEATERVAGSRNGINADTSIGVLLDRVVAAQRCPEVNAVDATQAINDEVARRRAAE